MSHHPHHNVELHTCEAAVSLLATNSFLTFETASTTLTKYLENILRNPDEPKFRKINKSNAAFQSRVGNARGGEDVLLTCGFIEMDGFYVLPPHANTDELNNALALLVTKAAELKEEEQQKVNALREKAKQERMARNYEKDLLKAQVAGDKAARKDPDWHAKMSSAAAKGGKAITRFEDVGVDLNAGGG